MSVYRISRGSEHFVLVDDKDGEIPDLLDWIISDHCQGASGTLMTRQDVVRRIGKALPDDFVDEDFTVGDLDKGGQRAWMETTVQAYLASAQRDDDEQPVAATDSAAGAVADAWTYKSRQWDDVEFSGADDRVLIVTSRGTVTPAGLVVAPPLGIPENLTRLGIKYKWAAGEDEAKPQIWVTGQALQDLKFPVPKAGDKVKLEDVVGDFFGCEAKAIKSGFFSCSLTSEDPTEWKDRKVDVVLVPYTHSEPSKSRPADRGIVGVVGTSTVLPADEVAAAHVLADRIAWLYSLEGALPGPRWSRVGATIASARMSKARPTRKNDPDAKLVPCPLPPRIAKRGKLPSQWWDKNSWYRDHRPMGEGVDVELDQQAAYLPSAAGLYFGWGTPEWQTPDPEWFDSQRPPQGLFEITTPPAEKCDGVLRELPVPHPRMKWKEASTFWATTVDVQQLTAHVENGGAGLTATELNISAAYVWPEQHQWLRQFSETLRVALASARAVDRLDYQQMIQAMYKAFFGRLQSVGESQWKYPHLNLVQPAWGASIEGKTRWRAMEYARRIGRDFDLYPSECLVDAWFYRIPEDMDPHVLEDPLREDGSRGNGTYRLKFDDLIDGNDEPIAGGDEPDDQ